MSVRDHLRERLGQMEVLEGVLPSRPQRSERLQELSAGLRSRDVEAAERSTRNYLEAYAPNVAEDSASSLFAASDAMREQAAGFAEAGVAFFFAKPELIEISPEERAVRGGNGSVSRVLVDNERIYLETPRVVVRFAPDAGDAARADIAQRRNLTVIGGEGLPPDTVRAAVNQGLARDVALALLDESGVEHAAPDFVEQIGQRITPADAEYARQWHHGPLRSESAWEHGRGGQIRVAVIDNGFAAAHSDLAGRIDPLSGWYRPTPDFADADFIPGTAGMPDRNHGTACAGMVAGRSGDQSGGCGVAFEAALQLIACLTDQIGTQTTLARAVAYAARPNLEPAVVAALGADIICCSLGPNGAVWAMQPVLEDALDFAAAQGRDGQGCAIFWASTNGNHPIGSDEVCSHPEVMAVGRSTRQDLDNGSGYGPQLEFLAPGVDVWIPRSPAGFDSTTGTSFAAPCAAGVGVLALAQHPSLTPHALRQLLRDTSDKVGPLPYINGRNTRFGFGRVNAERAVAEARRLANGGG